MFIYLQQEDDPECRWRGGEKPEPHVEKAHVARPGAVSIDPQQYCFNCTIFVKCCGTNNVPEKIKGIICGTARF